MQDKTKKIIRWLGLISLGLFALFASVIYVFLDCWSETGIQKNSLYCYVCISSNIRNFPLIGLTGEAKYSVDIQFGEPNESHPAYNAVEFSSNENPEQIMREASEYLRSSGFKDEKIGCPNYPQCSTCCASFSGKVSEVTVFVQPKTNIDGFSSAKNQKVSITETFKEKQL